MPSGFFGSTAVLGIEVAFASNSEQALKAALAVFPGRNDRKISSSAPPVYVVLTADHANDDQIREHRICGKQLRVVRNGITIEADGERGSANCSFCMDVTDTEIFRDAINTVVLFLVAQSGRTPVHAAAIMIGECAYVLAGRSGSGKSVLALAGQRAGLPVLAEDTVFVQLHPSFRVWGLAERIHVFEKDAPFGIDGDTRWRSGRLKRAIPVGDGPQSAEKAVLCVIERGDRVMLNPLSPEDAMRALIREAEAGYDFYGTRMEEAIRAVAAGSCWQLTLTRDPDAAIAALMDAFGDASAGRGIGRAPR
jgi:hypothetical protein